MPSANRVLPKTLATALAGLLVVTAGLQAAHAQGVGKATMSVGITIVAPAAEGEPSMQRSRPRIPVDPAHAVDPADPLREARVERVSLADGGVLQVVSY